MLGEAIIQMLRLRCETIGCKAIAVRLLMLIVVNSIILLLIYESVFVSVFLLLTYVPDNGRVESFDLEMKLTRVTFLLLCLFILGT